MSENLLVLTTAGTFKWLKEAIDTLRDPLDVLVVDDATPGREIADFCATKGLLFMTKPKPKGLTHSWNLAYEFFRKERYQNCILSNEDVRFPQGFSKDLLEGLAKFDLVGPLSNQPGTGHHQRIGRFLKIEPSDANIDQVQKALVKKYSEDPFMGYGSVNGFCFAFSKSIGKFMFSDELLFNPRKINTGNEYDLAGRLNARGGKIALCKTSYVFHWKGIILGKLRDRNNLWR